MSYLRYFAAYHEAPLITLSYALTFRQDAQRPRTGSKMHLPPTTEFRECRGQRAVEPVEPQLPKALPVEHRFIIPSFGAAVHTHAQRPFCCSPCCVGIPIVAIAPPLVKSARLTSHPILRDIVKYFNASRILANALRLITSTTGSWFRVCNKFGIHYTYLSLDPSS